jgi:hypothetical protein
VQKALPVNLKLGPIYDNYSESFPHV